CYDPLRWTCAESLTKRVGVRREAPHECLIDHNLPRLGLGIVGAREVAAGHKTHAHGGKILKRDDVEVGIQEIGTRRGLARRRHGHPDYPSATYAEHSEGDREDARNLA